MNSSLNEHSSLESELEMVHSSSAIEFWMIDKLQVESLDNLPI